MTDKEYTWIIIAGIAIIIYALRSGNPDKNRSYFDELGEKLGIAPVMTGGDLMKPDTPSIIGEYKGFHIEIDTIKPYKKDYYLQVEVVVKDCGTFSFKLDKEASLHRLGKEIGLVKDIQTGFDDFDKTFILQSNDIDKTLQIFDHELCFGLAEIAYLLDGPVELCKNKIMYQESMLIDTPEKLERILIITETFIQIASKISAKQGIPVFHS